MTDTIVQLCPNDGAPFAGLCTTYARAASRVDAHTTTVFFAPPAAWPVPDAVYLGLASMRDHRALVRALTAAVGDCNFDLAIAHRYRAYRALIGSRLHARHRVAVAHEFGFLHNRRRRWLARRNRGVVLAGVSEAVTRELPGPAICLPNPLDFDALEARALGRAAARAVLGLPEDGVMVGVVGRLHRKKRPELALAAFQAAAGRLRDARLVFVGGGELATAVGARSECPPVHILGPVPEAARLMRAFDCVLACSGPEEAFGMVVLEATALGIPVVAAPAPGPMEILGEAGHVAAGSTPDALAELLVAVLDRPQVSPALADRVRARYSVAAHAARLEALLRPATDTPAVHRADAS